MAADKICSEIEYQLENRAAAGREGVWLTDSGININLETVIFRSLLFSMVLSVFSGLTVSAAGSEVRSVIGLTLSICLRRVPVLGSV